MTCFLFIELCTDKHGWYRYNYHENLRLSQSDFKDNVERVDARTISREEFIENYEKLFKPVVLTHAQDSWMAKYKWTVDVSRGLVKVEFLVRPKYVCLG